MVNTEWQLSGSMAERYEEHLVPVIFVPWARDLLARAELQPGERLLDLACGTGIVARMAAGQGVQVTGGDINADMLAMARQFSDGLGIEYVEANAQALPFEANGFDAVICQQGLQFFPDKPGAVREVHRVLRPGGRAVFCVARGLNENPLMNAQVDAYGKFLGEEFTGALRSVCGFSDPDAVSDAMTGGGFAEVDVSHVVLTLNAPDARTYVQGVIQASPTAERIMAMDADSREALVEAILEGFGDCFDGRSLRFPHSANVVVARKAA